MAISEAQLVTWSKLGPTAQFTSTYDTLKNVLNHSGSPYYDKDFTIFLQGSYKNNTNVYGDSDVDVIIRLNSIFYTDLDQLPDEDKDIYNTSRSSADYSLEDFKGHVISWLVKNYGDNVDPGTKAIFINGDGNRRDADVLPCATLRRYYRFKGWNDQRYAEGICFFLPDGTRIENFPIQHSENCTAKHQNTKQWFKHTVRIYKNLRNSMINKNMIDSSLAPSYFLEGLLYNVPIEQFGGSEVVNFYDTLNWLVEADRRKFLCANEKFYLFSSSSPVTWRTEKCATFLKAALNY